MVRSDPSRLFVMQGGRGPISPADVLGALRKDLVVLVRGIGAAEADELMRSTAHLLGLLDQLELEAAMADSLGHRKLVSRFYMTVNQRADYQFVAPHCEGTSFLGMQLASFYSYDNTTDGGETILLNVDSTSDVWSSVRELRVKGKMVDGRALTRSEAAKIKMADHLALPEDLLGDGDQVLSERTGAVPGLKIFEVLSKPRKIFSRILDQDLYAFWDTIERVDLDSPPQFRTLLEGSGLLRLPPGGYSTDQLDADLGRRIWKSGIRYDRLFKAQLIHKLVSGELIILNNLTWAHGVANWSPASGSRKVAGAFC